MTAQTQIKTKIARSPAQLAAIRRSIGLRIGAEARAAARKRHIDNWLKNKIRENRIAAWKGEKIKAYYAAKPAKAAA
jgi:hypothetical protein